MRLLRQYLVWLTRAALWLAPFLSIVSAQTLTTIQDTLFSADGTRFNGSLTISWSTFDASGLGTVVQQSKTVPVTNGNLYVQLAPNVAANPPANLYTVLYQSDGYQQYTETWTVPAIATPLVVSQVRVGSSVGNSINGGVSASSSTIVTEASVTGLVNDLAQRPVKGASYAPGAVAVIDQNGQLEAAAGTPGSCVMVDGTTGPCGWPVPGFVDAEIPGGAVNGTNQVFTLQNSPSGSSLMLFRNGMYMLAGFDYTLIGSTIQFAAASVPQPGDILVASYRISSTNAASSSNGGSSGTGQSFGTPLVICSGAGSTTSSTSSTSLGSCTIPSASLVAGARIEIRFTFAHTGSASGFTFETDWGSTPILTRQASAQDAAAAGSADAALGASTSQISYQSWGSVLPIGAGIQSAATSSGASVSFKAMLTATASDTVSLASYTVLLYPLN